MAKNNKSPRHPTEKQPNKDIKETPGIANKLDTTGQEDNTKEKTKKRPCTQKRMQQKRS